MVSIKILKLKLESSNFQRETPQLLPDLKWAEILIEC